MDIIYVEMSNFCFGEFPWIYKKKSCKYDVWFGLAKGYNQQKQGGSPTLPSLTDWVKYTLLY